MSIELFYNNALDLLEELYNATRGLKSHTEVVSLKNRFIREIDNMVGDLEKMSIFISPSSCSSELHYELALKNLRHLFDLAFTKNGNTISTSSLTDHELRLTQAKVIAYMKNLVDIYEKEQENSYYNSFR